MKRRHDWVLTGMIVIGTAMTLAACTTTPVVGPEGPLGPVGPVGPQGPIGPQGEPGPTGPSEATYVGSAECAGCHAGIVEAHAGTGHAWSLAPVDGAAPDYPHSSVSAPPAGYTWDQIAYVIGGYAWKAIFVDQDGYIVTAAPDATEGDAAYLSQFNLANPDLRLPAAWASYKAGETQVPYDCGSCHNTGYRPNGQQDGKTGVIGTWAEAGVQCEACHGPASLHIESPDGAALQVERDSEVCIACHQSGDGVAVAATNGLIAHGESYEDLTQSQHRTLDCVACHDPHTGVVQMRAANEPAVTTECAACHFKEAKYAKVDRHASFNFTCESCHMPQMISSATGDPALFTGDLRTHVMAIDVTQIGQFEADGVTVKPQIALDFACRSCHTPGTDVALDDALLVEMATGYHAAP